MKRNNIILILSVIAMVAMIYQQQQRETVSQKFQLFMPELRNNFNDITKITLQNRDDITTLIKQDGGKWVVTEQNNYPVNMQELRKMLLYLSQSELRAKKTNDPTRFNRLGLDDLIGKKLQIFEGEKLLYDVVLGSLTSDLNATYVRKQGNNQTYKASGELQFHATPENWLDFGFISIAHERVHEIAYRFKGKQPYQYVRQNAAEKMQLTPAPLDNITQKSITSNPETYFERLAFTATQKPEDASIKGDITTMTTFDGLKIELEFYEFKFIPWVKIYASVDIKVRKQFAGAKLKPLDEIELEAANINAITTGWIYQLGQFQQQNLSRSYMDLTEIKPN